MKKVVDKDRKEEIKRTGGLRLSSVDILILMILYKVWWACDYHLALLVDEPVAYVRGRLKQFAAADLIGRQYIAAKSHACNYIKYKGMRAIGKTKRHVRIPTAATYEHDLGEIDMYTVMCMEHKGKHYTRLGSVITERDMLALVPKQVVGKSKTGKSVYKDVSKVHIPDGYIEFPDGLVALEYERTLKSKSSTTRTEDNYMSNNKRFVKQLWFCEKKCIIKKLKESGVDDGLILMSNVRELLGSFIAILPSNLSKKSGRIRKDNVGQFEKPVAVDKLPIISIDKVILER